MSKFTDTKGWYPGLEDPAERRVFFRDVDASTVVPSVGNANYSDADRRLERESAAGVLRPGPRCRDHPDRHLATLLDAGVAIGVSIEVKRVAKDNSYATVRVVPAP